MIPPWLRETHAASPPACGRPRGRSFLEKTIRASAAFLDETVLTDIHARRAGVLQGVEPRCKLLALLLLIVSVSILRSPWLIWGVYLLAIPLAAASRIDLRFFTRRVWLFVPLFTLAIALPALFNVITPGEPLLVVARFGTGMRFGPWRLPAELAVTREGVACALLLVGRVAASVSLALLLTLTTPWPRLLAALNGVRIPALFTMTMAMAYRYLFLLVAAVADMHLARRSRTVRYLPTGAEQRWVAGRAGHLFRKSFQMSVEVYGAMLSRGFSGEAKAAGRMSPAGRDCLWPAGAAIICALLLFADRSLIRP